MFKYTAIEKTNHINNEFKRYIKSTFTMDNPHLAKQFDKQINEVDLVKGPFISVVEPFKTGKTIMELVDEGILNKGFSSLHHLSLNRPLYLHQEEAIRKSTENKNLVVSTGTGSGKTESFLIPIINEILDDRENGITDCGVQALLLYPMNALANDQRERLRTILEDNPEITFGFYTGETLESQKRALAIYREENNRNPLPNEIISREKLRENPPNILFTNYTMLEYMLLRPFDNVLFSEENTKHWHYVVMDEAHVYRGALGIEISLLLKRLLGKISSKPKFILTSATLAQNKEDFPDVASFASKLTSQHFTLDSVVVGTREPVLIPNNSIVIDKSRYVQYLDNDKHIMDDYNRLLKGSELNPGNQLYELIRHDKNFFKFKDTLIRPMDLDTLKKRLPDIWTDSEITALIDVVSKINSYEDNFLIDIKYHTFVKALDGAHVVLKPVTKLFLKNINSYELNDVTDESNSVKTFQLGLCKYCNEAYLMGTIINDTFYKIDDEELYTNYGEGHHKNTDFLLIKEFVENIDDLDLDEIKFINLCNKCGHIYDVANENATKCSCGDKYLIETIKSDKEDGKNKTNLSKCLSCGSQNTGGVIESFYIGKDSATALVAQILYRSMGKESKKENIKSSNPFTAIPQISKEDEYIKQFIAFSDSRQQASYFATIFDHFQSRFLRKRIMISILEDYKFLDAKRLIDELEYLIESKELFQVDDNNVRNAWITYLIDLLDVERNFSLSGLGLLAFVPKIDFDDVTDEMVAEHFDGMDKETFIKLVYFIINTMRYKPAIDYDDAKVPFTMLQEHLQYRHSTLTGLVLKLSKDNKYERALLPSNKGGNEYSNYLEKSLNIDRETSTKYLEFIWNYLISTGAIYPSNGVYKYNSLNFNIYNRKHLDWYQCDKCRTLTYININQTCIKSKCDGSLMKVEPDEIHKNNYYYSEYLSNEIENIRVEEHTAQLTREKGREYQRDFQDGKINILSSSTTFEMGVDLGNLDTVFMRNIPPTPANYVQRAGRAGRRKDTASYVLTFSSNQSHDYTYYKDPIKMIEGSIKPPSFEVKNQKIIDRHILSVAMSMFFKEHSKYFDRIETFVFENGLENFKLFLLNNKDKFIGFITEYIQSDFDKRFDEWFDSLFNNEESHLNVLVVSTEEKIKQINEYIKSGDISDSEIGRYEAMKSNILRDSTLNVLSNYSVIPKYGFPIDTVNLQVPSDKNLDLNRDLAIAISEYAPGSEIIVDKNKYRSRYINVRKGSRPIEYFYKICPTCNSLTMKINANDPELKACKNCESDLGEFPNKFIKPIYGFTTELDPINDKILKPKKTYGSDYYYVGNLSEDDTEENFGNIVKARLVKENRLAVINDSPFFMCESCGYAYLDYENEYHNHITKEHKLPHSIHNCPNKKLVRKSLGHDFTTDVVMVHIDQETDRYEIDYSLLYALLEGISIALEIERDDISGIIENVNNSIQIVLFDTIPGGAGHVRRLLNRDVFLSVINASLEKVSQECCDVTSSCYNCLRNYRNETLHPYLIRGKAKDALEKLKVDLESTMIDLKYNIYKYVKENPEWSDSNIVDIFGHKIDLLDKIIETNVKTPNYVFASIDFYNIELNPLLIWEEEKIMLVEDLDEVSQEIKGWRIFDLDNLEELFKELI